ncbi:MAG: hypothetical protein R3321_04705 [Nitrososphaeraceae archaeon]|nr:hypothetical protein [Nitrososphaeraceae archaeon]
MLDEIRKKVRALGEDISSKCPIETFTYSNSNIFKLCANNVIEVVEVLVNGNPLPSGDSFTLDSSTNSVTVDTTFTTGDQILITYKCTKYTDSEIDEYIRGALVWLSIFSFCSDEDFELEGTEIFPTPSNKETDLISLIASILLKPDFSEYRTPILTVRFPKTMSKEDRIERLINRFKSGLGVVKILEWHDDHHSPLL